MCQTLFVIPYEVHGVPVFGAGILLLCWLIGSVILFVRLVRRGRFDAEARSHVVPVVLVGAAIWFVPRLFPGGLPIRGYGTMLLVGASTGVGLAVYRARQMGLNADLVFSLAFWMVLPGVVGARLFHVIEYWADYRGESAVETLVAIINVPKGGLVVYGSLVGAGIGFMAFVGKYRLPGLAIADLIAPSLPIGLALGRIGCLLNGCCYGGACNLPWAVTFPAGSPPYESQVIRGQITGIDPHAAPDAAPRLLHSSADTAAGRHGLRGGDRLVRVNGHEVETTQQARCCLQQAYERGTAVWVETEAGRRLQLPARSLPVHPTQVYSAVAALLLGTLLWCYYPFRSRDGSVLALMLSVYPIQRILLEMIRVDEPAVFRTGLSISQNVSLLLIVGVAGLWWHILRRREGCALSGRVSGGAIGDWPGRVG